MVAPARPSSGASAPGGGRALARAGGWLAALVPAAVVAGLVSLAGLAAGRVYSGTLLPQLIAGAAVGAVLISLALRRAPSWLVAPVSVLALVGYLLLAVRLSAASALITGPLAEVARDAARNAVPRLLTALIPIEPQPDTVLAPIVLAWLAALGGAELTARLSRPALGLLPPLFLYASALVLVGPNASLVIWQPLLFAALAAIGVAVAGPPSPRGAAATAPVRVPLALRVRTATGLGAGLVAVLVLIALVAPFVARAVVATPTDPRTYVAPPSLDILDQNPLMRVAGWAAYPKQHLFDVSLAGNVRATAAADAEVAAHDTRLRLAVLSDWDGVTWHVGGDYLTAGRVLPDPVPPPAGDGQSAPEAGEPREINQRVTIAELNGRLLPAIAAPAKVDGVRVAYDPLTGTMIRPDGLSPGVTYTVDSVNPAVDVNLLPAADVPSGEAVARYLAVGDTVPTDLTQFAEKITNGAGSPYLRAQALETFLADHYTYAPDAPSGHAYPNLRFFLLQPTRLGGQRGTSEQFAASFAALARLVGLPSRVVVGFRLPAKGGAVRASHGIAWPEVLFNGVGWVPFNPMPEPKATPEPIDEEFIPKVKPPSEPPVTVDPPQESTTASPPPRSVAVASSEAGTATGLIAGGIGGGVALLVVVVLLALFLLRAARHRALAAGDAQQRVLGAWDEVGDALTLAGVPPPDHLSARELAMYAAEVAEASPRRQHTRHPRPAVPPLDDLADMVNAVGFAGSAIGGMGAGDEAAAEAARRTAAQYAAALRARRSWWRRLLWRVDPRPLRRR
ncbi:DUF3488 and transglutaminase-like domain-containing protein [Luedemannella helvata]|uniref:Transglutaminase-like domain-containing protein n=1 Tax=Luedemannella helvata TaxID=349315 RepID=A0ABN2KYU3_9ACTN